MMYFMVPSNKFENNTKFENHWPNEYFKTYKENSKCNKTNKMLITINYKWQFMA